MKVLFISNDSTIFDATSSARARMRAYAGAIGELHILSSAGRDVREEQDGNLFLHPIHSWKIFRVRALTKKAHEIILKHGIEVVSAQDPFEHGLAALRAISKIPAFAEASAGKQSSRPKLHIQVHTDFLSPWFIKSGNWRSPSVRMPLLNRWRRRIADRVLPSADGIRVVSERVKASLIARYGNKIKEPSVIPVFVDATVPEPVRLPEHQFTFALIAVGRLEPEKRIEDILAALKLVAKQYPMVGIFVVGEGSERGRLGRMARTLGLANRVIFLGSRSDARGLIASAQAFIQASAYEGYSRTLIEAALAKVPIITTDVGVVGEVFKGYEDVLSVPVADPTALSLSIVGLIEDNAVRHQLPLRAEEAVRAHLANFGDIPTRIAKNLEQTLKHS